jgi:hypothetical protein
MCDHLKPPLHRVFFMALEIQENEPISFVAGNTVKWRKTLSDYPATVWTLTYSFVQSGDYQTIVADADGDDHVITISATDSADFSAGVYDYQATVTDGSETMTVGEGKVSVKPDFASQTDGFDNRSHAKKMIDILEPLLLTIAAKGHATYTIGGRSMTYRTESALRRDLAYWRAIYASEERKAGRKKRSTIKVRFL